MFDPIHNPTESNDTLFDAGVTGDADPGSSPSRTVWWR